MNINEYLTESARTAAGEPDLTKAFSNSATTLLTSVIAAVRVGNTCDAVKRSLFYKEVKEKTDDRYAKACVEYTNQVTELNKRLQSGDDSISIKDDYLLLHALLGIGSELGELMSEFIQSKLDGREFDKVNLLEELGDIMWYMAMAIRELDKMTKDTNMGPQTFESVATANINKLKARYPHQFTSDNALQRDVEAEKVALTS